MYEQPTSEGEPESYPISQHFGLDEKAQVLEEIADEDGKIVKDLEEDVYSAFF